MPFQQTIAGKTPRQYYRDYYWANRDEKVRHLRERQRARAAKVRDQVEAAFTGRRFGALVTLYPLVRTNKHLGGWWLCRCDCGGEIEAWTYKLKRGVKTSCGCHIHARAKRAEPGLQSRSGSNQPNPVCEDRNGSDAVKRYL